MFAGFTFSPYPFFDIFFLSFPGTFHIQYASTSVYLHFDGLSGSRIRWIVPVLGAKVNPGLGCSMVFRKNLQPYGSIFSLKTLALPTPYLFEAPETQLPQLSNPH